MTDIARRSLLAAVGVAATAGCLTASRDTAGGDSPATEPGNTTTGTGTPTPRTESRERETTESDDVTTGGDWVERASNRPDPDQEITLANRADAARTVEVRVERAETGETVFETAETVEPGVELDLYNLKKASPDGVEAFEICGELVDAESAAAGRSTTGDAARSATDDTESRTTNGDELATAASGRTTTASERRDCATIRTNECYANAHVTVQDDGSLQVIYAIC